MATGFLKHSKTLMLGFAAAVSAYASSPVEITDNVSGSELLWKIQKMNTLGRVLYVAAHPDDENTSLVSYLSLGRKYDTAYLSLTRGDGGQNLIGPELRDQLGLIRTQELLAARTIDGGKQFFSRARDFGYSKTPGETFRIWDREAVLADTVWAIRKFRPDVIVTRFNPQPSSTHGHHTASAMLALEAFEAAADPSKFPEQLEWVEPWQAKRIAWNTSSWFFRNNDVVFEPENYLEMEVGGYDPLLGKSYNEVASLSRSMHRSQGFGTLVSRGVRNEYFKFLAGDKWKGDLFDGVDTTWSRVSGAAKVSEMLNELMGGFDVSDPSASVAKMLELRTELTSPELGEWGSQKLRELDSIILGSMGFHARALSSKKYLKGGDKFELAFELINRSALPAKLSSVEIPFASVSEKRDDPLGENSLQGVRFELDAPTTLDGQPYWLREKGTVGMFEVDDQTLIGLPENEPSLVSTISIEVMGTEIPVTLPVVYREVNPAKGEEIDLVTLLPAASVEFTAPVKLFPNFEERDVEVKVSALLDGAEGDLELVLPEGWSSVPKSVPVERLLKGASKSYVFRVSPSSVSQEIDIQARLVTESETFQKSVEQIRYDHIPELTLFGSASSKGVSLEVARLGQKVAYLQGAGDAMPESIREIGFEVTELSPGELGAIDLGVFDAVVLGIRAYNTVDEIDSLLERLFSYAEAGGTVVAQYNTTRGLKGSLLAPFDLQLSRDRVTDENSEVRFLAPEHPVLSKPNHITENDFSGWTQERGLYFPDSWGAEFTPILGMNDIGEPSRDGSLLVAEFGDGYFVYSGISWFRQLPAGVPGAYRLFANILSLGQPE
ncbi:PIG-L family deacetylase [Pelagicoccus albus]|uniref:PIG-L family deacetylase n=1 Tax=Pelagicoccus albus TaxID=415222 RepID=A0A7X1B4T2_9BACT|nr:PIG-L family deacetylase [Pelagicoccus albus]MBC2604528.1 PIG-L family deacetylase [Pelagicoccus albus]